MQNRNRLAFLSTMSLLAIGTANWACSSAPGPKGGTGGEEETGGSGDTGGKGGSSTGGKSGGTGGSTGGSGGSATGGSVGSTGGSGGATGGSSGSGGSGGGTGGATGGSGGGGAGGGEGGPLTLKVLGMDETMAHAGGPVYTPAMSNTSNKSPAMMWSGAPAGTKSFAISMIDTQTPPSKTPPLKAGTSKKVHFVIFNIPATANMLPAAMPRVAMPPEPAGTFQSATFSGFGWFGPGGATSVYNLQLWALDVEKLPGINAGASQGSVYNALAGHAIGKPFDYLAAGTNGGFK